MTANIRALLLLILALFVASSNADREGHHVRKRLLSPSDPPVSAIWECELDEPFWNETLEFALDEARRATGRISECCIFHERCYHYQRGRTWCDEDVCRCVHKAIQKSEGPGVALAKWNGLQCAEKLANSTSAERTYAIVAKRREAEAENCDLDCRRSFGISIFVGTLVFVIFLLIIFCAITRPSKMERVKKEMFYRQLQTGGPDSSIGHEPLVKPRIC
ncbi:unnamed protein product, partial [Mesorhabditis spiculigera]